MTRVSIGALSTATCAALALGCGGPAAERRDDAVRSADGSPASDGGVATQHASTGPGAASAEAVGPHLPKSHIGRHPQERTPPLSQPFPPPPIPAPTAGEGGCLEGIGDYKASLEAHQQSTRDAELAALGARRESREGFFVDDSFLGRLGTEYEAAGRRFAVVAHSDQRTARVKVELARRGKQLHLVEDHARSIPVTLTVCGVRPCPVGSGVMVRSRAVSIELADDESLGEPLVLHYDFWWPQLGYTKSRVCPPPPPSAMSR